MTVLLQNLETFEEYMAARKIGSKSSASVVSMANGSVHGDKQSAAGRASCAQHIATRAVIV